MAKNDAFSYHVNKEILKQKKELKKNDELIIYNYQCEDCNAPFVTDIAWLYKCDDCHKNYYEDSNGN